jgi:predicted ArsR family transcriptional regulator
VEQEQPGLAALSGLGDRVRGQLYEFVSGSADPVSRDEAAAAAGIGRGLAAYHLDKLVDLGLLTAGYQRPAGRAGPGAGRPAKVYSRSGREFAVSVPPREYELAARLLARAVETGDGTSRTALQAAARQCGAELGARHQAGHATLAGATQAGATQAGATQAGTTQAGTTQDGATRASARQAGARQAAEAALREHGFEPWHDQTGTIRLRNCPFHQLAAEHPELTCGMNLALIEGITDGLGAGGLCPALDPGPGRCCVVIGTDEPIDRKGLQ